MAKFMRSILGRNAKPAPMAPRPAGGSRPAAAAPAAAPAARPFPDNPETFAATFHGVDDRNGQGPVSYRVADLGGGKFNVGISSMRAPVDAKERAQYGPNGKVEDSYSFETDQVHHDPSTGVLSFKNNSISGRGQINKIPTRMGQVNFDNREGALPGGKPAKGAAFPSWASHMQNTGSWSMGGK